MSSTDRTIQDRLARLETRLRRTELALVLCLAGSAAIVMLALRKPPPAAGPGASVTDEIRTRRLVVVDDQGVARVVVGQDPVDTQRRSRSAGITIHDRRGHERGGMGTFDDDSVVLALDAPVGVGSPMRDRLGLMVGANGAAAISLINNETGVPVRLISEADGSGGVEFIDYDLPGRKAFIKRLDFKGESTREVSLDE